MPESNLDLHIMVDVFVPILVAVIASSGFWVILQKRVERRSLQTELLIGLAHDRIIWLGMHYIKRGWISQDEYENLNVYLFQPYDKLGGNGTARRIMQEIEKLPIQTNTSISKRSKENDVHE